MTLLILGAGGQVGRALVERAGAQGLGCDRAACDITDPISVIRSLSAPALSVVVNCAAYTAVDRAESDREAAYAINAEGAGIVARASAARGLPVIHLSTDYVYAGTCVGPHRETEPIAPVNVYGASKAAGDVAVAAANPAHLLLRVSWVFGVYGAESVLRGVSPSAARSPAACRLILEYVRLGRWAEANSALTSYERQLGTATTIEALSRFTWRGVGPVLYGAIRNYGTGQQHGSA